MKPRPALVYSGNLIEHSVHQMVEGTGIQDDLIVTKNYMEIAGLVEDHKISRLIIIMGAYNSGKIEPPSYTGQGAATELHKIDPGLPILILNGRDVWKADQGWYSPPLQFPNEVYVEMEADDDWEDRSELIRKFYEGRLTQADVPKAEFIGWFS